MKKFIILLLVIIIITSCEEDVDTPEVVNQSDGWLIAPETGWKHVMTIPYEKPSAAREGNDWLSAYDMTLIGDEIGILYSANYYLGDKGPIKQFYKVKFKENDSNVGSGTALQVIGTTSRTTFHSQLVPNSLIPVFINFAGTEQVELYDENDSKMAMFLTNNVKEINYYYTPNGNFLGAGLDETYASHFWNLQYPQTTFAITDIKLAKDRKSFKSTFVIPLKLSDNNYYTLSVGKEGTKTRYQLLKLLPERDYNIEINYEKISEGELTGVPASNLRGMNESLVAYDVQSDVVTFVIGDYEDINSAQINKLHCYRWNKATNEFTTLWETEPISRNLSNGILDNVTSEYKYRENRLTSDGTFYTLFTKEKYRDPDLGTRYTILYTVNAAGVKESGKLDELYNNSVVITTCRYMNGGYYALVYPWNDAAIKKDDAKFHLELVKLNIN